MHLGQNSQLYSYHNNNNAGQRWAKRQELEVTGTERDLGLYVVSQCFPNRKFCLSLLSLQPLARRAFSLQDASAALRPFYFIVHPDFFGQFPAERTVNENSLKILNQYLAEHHSRVGRRHPKTQDINFYMRVPGQNGHLELKLLKLRLKAKTLKDAVVAILRTCDLPHDQIVQATVPDSNRPIDWHPSYYAATGQKNPKASQMKQPTDVFLRSWLQRNIQRSRLQTESIRYITEDIDRLLEKLKSDLALGSIRCESVWGLHHFRGCLKSFDRMYGDHPEFLRTTLKDRTLVFSNGTGVNRFGEIILSSEDVPEYWYTLLMSVGAYNAVLLRLPTMESKLSALLNNISILWREKRHCTVMAEVYELLLNRLLNVLRQRQDLVQKAFGEKNLSHLQLVVESEGNPMMLSSMGQFLIPASIPGNQVIDFIKANQTEAVARMTLSNKLLNTEEEVTQQAIETLGVKELNKDESISPSQMISCCQRLDEQHGHFDVSLENIRLRISHFYSVMQDGEICIPWDWLGFEAE